MKKQRFGQVVKADIVLSPGEVEGGGLEKMLVRHQADVTKFIKKSVRTWEEEKKERDESDEDELDVEMEDLPVEVPTSVRMPIGT